MKILYRLGQGLPNTLLVTAGIAVAGFCSGIILAQTLTPTARGEFAAVLIWPGALALFGEFGLGFAFCFYVGQNKAYLNGLWTLALVVSLIWGGLLFLAGAFILPGVVQLSAVARSCLIWNLMTVPFSLLTGYASYLLLGSNVILEFNIVRFLCAALYMLGVLAVALGRQASVESYTLIYIVSQILATAFAVGLVIGRLKPAVRWQQGLAKPVFIYGAKTYLSSLAAQTNLRLGQLLMSVLVASQQLGLYVVAVSFSNMLIPLFNALAIVTLPRVTHAPDLRAGGRQIVRHLQLGTVIGIPVMVAAIIATPWLLPFLFSPKFAPSIFMAQILLAAAVFQGSNLVLGNGLRGLGQPGKTALSEGAGVCVTIILLVLLLPVYGGVGAAIASFCAYALVSFMQLLFMRKATDLEWHDFWVVSWEHLFPEIDVLRQWWGKLYAAFRRSD